MRKKLLQLSLFVLLIFYLTTTNTSYIAQAQSTNILNQDTLLTGYAQKQWYKDNIPFLEVPDPTIQEVYYYRWSTIKRHLKYSRPGTGYVLSEFVNPVGYSSAYDGINAAAGHHIYEGRWIRDPRYLDDYIMYWLRGPGYPGKRQYSFWLANAAYSRYLINSDANFVKEILPDLIDQYNGWQDHFNSGLGLYWQVPVWDAMEFTIGSYQTNDPYHGGKGYRPTLNVYQFADARAIARIATLRGQASVATDFNNRAGALKTNVQNRLWDSSRSFFFHMMTDNAAQAYPYPEGTLLNGREQMGYTPWAFNMPDNTTAFASAWSQLIDPNGFKATYGPTTAERRHAFFMRDATAGCCRWDGPQWPFSTSLTLMGMANLLGNYTQSAVNKTHYYDLLRGYALLQHKNGKPYIAEAAHPDTGAWIYDGVGHSEHYNHSTYNDLVITGLIGVKPREDNVFEVYPLIPDNWDYFVLENLYYHGHNMTVLWDRTGSRYGRGAGLKIYQNGVQIASSTGIGRLTASLLAPIAPNKPPRKENYAANPNGTSFPTAIASYTGPLDNAARAFDGRIYYDDVPNSRWTNYQSPNASDWLGVNFVVARPVNEVRLYLYDDGGGVKTPAGYDIQYWNGSAWVTVPGQVKSPAAPSGNNVNVITFNQVTTTQLRALFTNPAGAKVGVVEFEVWYSAPAVNQVYEAEHAGFNNSQYRSSTNASGLAYVGGIDFTGGISGDNKEITSYVHFVVNVPSAGNYPVTVRYGNGGVAATHSVRVNNGNSFAINFPPTAGWGQFADASMTVALNAGYNTIRFTKGNNYAELDKITIGAGTGTPTNTPVAVPTNTPVPPTQTPPGATNVALNKAATASGSCNTNEGPNKAVNGSVSGGNIDKWCSNTATKWMQVDLGSSFAITQLVVRHAGAGGESSAWNTNAFNIQLSNDNATWTTPVNISGNTANVTTHNIPVTSARYVRLNITNAGGDGVARIYELEVYGVPPRLKSFNFQTSYVRHANSRFRIDSVISPLADSQFRIVSGLADATAISFESVNFPGSFLRHRNGEIWLDVNDNTATFRADATWRRRPGLANASWVSYESYNFPGQYLRHQNSLLFRTAIATDVDRADATFQESN